MDAHSRYLLCCQALTRTKEAAVKPFFEAAFRQYGMPEFIRSDNGGPFASLGLGGLSRLSVWWWKLGITPERIHCSHPEENSRQERMHLTLNEDVTHSPSPSISAQQEAFDKFRLEYNEDRPHEALDFQTPSNYMLFPAANFLNRLKSLIILQIWKFGEFVAKVKLNGRDN